MATTLDQQLQRARQLAQKHAANLRRLEHRASQAERNRDTRRKIILGGLLLDAASKEGNYATAVRRLIARITRDGDRVPFDGWEPPSPEQTLAEAAPAGSAEPAAPVPDGASGTIRSIAGSAA